MTVSRATSKDIEVLAALATKLWPGHEPEELAADFAGLAASENADSLRFHLRAGFAEAGRIICFRKDL